MLVWSYQEKEFKIGHNPSLTIIRGEKDGLIFKKDNLSFAIDPQDINHIIFEKPTLFKKGMVAFFDSDGQVLTYICDGRRIPLVLEVTRDDTNKKDGNFYIVYSILNENGFKLIAG